MLYWFCFFLEFLEQLNLDSNIQSNSINNLFISLFYSKHLYYNRSMSVTISDVIAIIGVYRSGNASLQRSSVHEQKKFWTSNVPVFFKQPWLSFSDVMYPQSRTTRGFPKTFCVNENKENSD